MNQRSILKKITL